jgi:SAM-dependent methyltransferase
MSKLPDPRADVRAYNGAAWDSEVGKGNRWTRPVSPEEVARARAGEVRVVLTPRKPVPRDWFPESLRGVRVLCLASGGGQQGPLLAAAGAQVTVLDFSQQQLVQDRLVAAREGLQLDTIRGDMADLSMLPDACFDLIFHPCSNCFAAKVRPVWRECARVLRPGGTLLAGFTNPVLFAFDPDELEAGRMVWRWPIPYSDLESLTAEELRRYTDPGEPLVFGHTLEDQLGGQVDAGLCITGFFEDRGDSEKERVLHQNVAGYIATRAVKLAGR